MKSSKFGMTFLLLALIVLLVATQVINSARLFSILNCQYRCARSMVKRLFTVLVTYTLFANDISTDRAITLFWGCGICLDYITNRLGFNIDFQIWNHNRICYWHTCRSVFCKTYALRLLFYINHSVIHKNDVFPTQNACSFIFDGTFCS